jgi:predicted dehydrogenase
MKRPPPVPKRSIGLAVVGAGKIGRHRARLAARHAGVGFLAIADIETEKARDLAAATGADAWAARAGDVVSRPEVDAVIVSTQENAHAEPVLAALRAGKPTLVEKPLALTAAEGEQLVAAAREHHVPLHVGYSMRYAQRYAVGKQQLEDKQIGGLVGGLARCYDTQAVGMTILQRVGTATPVMDILTYLVDIVGWYHPARPTEVVARSHGTILRSRGHDVDDVTWALVTFEDGSVFDFGVSYSLPHGFPINGMATRIELIGTDGVLFITEDHGDQVLYTEAGYRNAYIPGQELHLAYLGSRTSGEWAMDTMFGRVADETRAWLDHLTTGAPCHVTTGEEALRTLRLTLAIEDAARTGGVIHLD